MIKLKSLKNALHYNINTGVFTWLLMTGHRRTPGNIAGHINKTVGYIEIGLYGKKYYAHRLAWFYVYGYFPEHGVDHIDRNKTNNAIKNLREASQQCNLRNYGNPKHNTSGVKGVCWDKNSNKWMSQVKINQKTKHLGCYIDFKDAVCARLAAEQCVAWSGCDSSSPAYQYVIKNIQTRR